MSTGKIIFIVLGSVFVLLGLLFIGIGGYVQGGILLIIGAANVVLALTKDVLIKSGNRKINDIHNDSRSMKGGYSHSDDPEIY
jgi:hypothetical protein